MRPILFGLLAAALLAQNADAQKQVSANDAVAKCQKLLAHMQPQQRQPFDFDEGVCLGIIEGLVYTITFLPPQFNSCPPPGAGVTMQQMIRVVVAYIERRPERMHEDFRTLTLEAWHEAWPCQ